MGWDCSGENAGKDNGIAVVGGRHDLSSTRKDKASLIEKFTRQRKNGAPSPLRLDNERVNGRWNVKSSWD